MVADMTGTSSLLFIFLCGYTNLSTGMHPYFLGMCIPKFRDVMLAIQILTESVVSKVTSLIFRDASLLFIFLIGHTKQVTSLIFRDAPSLGIIIF